MGDHRITFLAWQAAEIKASRSEARLLDQVLGRGPTTVAPEPGQFAEVRALRAEASRCFGEMLEDMKTAAASLRFERARSWRP